MPDHGSMPSRSMAIGKSDNDVHHRREIIQPDDCMAYEAASNGQTA